MQKGLKIRRKLKAFTLLVLAGFVLAACSDEQSNIVGVYAGQEAGLNGRFEVKELSHPKFPENTFAIRGELVCKLSHRGGVAKAISKHIRFNLQDNQLVSDYNRENVGSFDGKHKITLTGSCAGTYTKVDD